MPKPVLPSQMQVHAVLHLADADVPEEGGVFTLEEVLELDDPPPPDFEPLPLFDEDFPDFPLLDDDPPDFDPLPLDALLPGLPTFGSPLPLEDPSPPPDFEPLPLDDDPPDFDPLPLDDDAPDFDPLPLDDEPPPDFDPLPMDELVPGLPTFGSPLSL